MMDVRSVHSSPGMAAANTGTLRQRSDRVTADQAAGGAQANAQARSEQAPVLSADEQQFFEGLFPGSGSEVRGHQAYSVKGEARTNASIGTMVDRKG